MSEPASLQGIPWKSPVNRYVGSNGTQVVGVTQSNTGSWASGFTWATYGNPTVGPLTSLVFSFDAFAGYTVFGIGSDHKIWKPKNPVS